MSLIINGTTIPASAAPAMSGSPVNKIVCNGTEVWKKGGDSFTITDFSGYSWTKSAYPTACAGATISNGGSYVTFSADAVPDEASVHFHSASFSTSINTNGCNRAKVHYSISTTEQGIEAQRIGGAEPPSASGTMVVSCPETTWAFSVTVNDAGDHYHGARITITKIEFYYE